MPDIDPRPNEVRRIAAVRSRSWRRPRTGRVGSAGLSRRGGAAFSAGVVAILAAGLAGCGIDGSLGVAAPGSPTSAADSAGPITAGPGTGGDAPTPEVPVPAPAPGTLPGPAPVDGQSAPPDLVQAARVGLPLLPVKGRAPKTGYERDLFGQAWSDDVTVAGGHNGCDTRNDVLARDLVDIAFKPGTRDCVVLTGTLLDPYSGENIAFTRGKDSSRAVQIDHLVALSDAWQKGAQQLSEEQRRNLANDPLNLEAVSGPVNQQKSDGDAATWLPPATGYRCEYVARQVVVKQEYGLWVTQAEHDAIERELAGCPAAEPAPAPESNPEPMLEPAPAPEQLPPPAEAPVPA